MIRINLLPVRKVRRRETGIQTFVVFVVLALLGLVGLYAWYRTYDSRVMKLEAKVAAEKRMVAKLQQAIALVNQYKGAKAKLEEKIGVIELLKKAKTGPVRVLDELSLRIPKKVWLRSLTEKSRKITVEGLAESHDDVATFLKELQNSPYFTAVELQFSRKVQAASIGSGRSTVTRIRFKFTCRAVYPS